MPNTIEEWRQLIEFILILGTFISAVWIATPKGFGRVRRFIDVVNGWASGYRWDKQQRDIERLKRKEETDDFHFTD